MKSKKPGREYCTLLGYGTNIVNAVFFHLLNLSEYLLLFVSFLVLFVTSRFSSYLPSDHHKNGRKLHSLPGKQFFLPGRPLMSRKDQDRALTVRLVTLLRAWPIITTQN